MIRIKRLCKLWILLPVAAFVLLGIPTLSVADDSMVGYWKFEEGSGSVALDSVGPYDGVIEAFGGGATWIPGRVGQALLLDGDDCVTVTDEESLNLSGDITLEGWVRFNSLFGGGVSPYNAAFLVAKNGGGPTWVLGYPWDSPGPGFQGRLVTATQNSSVVTTIPAVETGHWYHMVVTHKQDDVDVLYIDGLERNSQSTQGLLQCGEELPDCGYPNRDINFGCRTNDGLLMNFVIGAIDEIAIYNRALTAEEVLTHYENGLQGIGYVPVHECVGFESPLASGPVTLRGKNRALPFKAQLLDAEGSEVTDSDITAPPVIQVWWEYGTPEAGDEPEDVLPAGKSTEGNQFFFDSDQRWHFNLKTKDHSASGTYTVFMESGDPSEYLIDPTCVAEFVVQ